MKLRFAQKVVATGLGNWRLRESNPGGQVKSIATIIVEQWCQSICPYLVAVRPEMQAIGRIGYCACWGNRRI